MQDKDNKSSFRLWHAFAATAALLLIIFCSYTAARAYDFKKTQDAVPLSAEAVYDLNEILCAQYPEEHHHAFSRTDGESPSRRRRPL